MSDAVFIRYFADLGDSVTYFRPSIWNTWRLNLRCYMLLWWMNPPLAHTRGRRFPGSTRTGSLSSWWIRVIWGRADRRLHVDSRTAAGTIQWFRPVDRACDMVMQLCARAPGMLFHQCRTYCKCYTRRRNSMRVTDALQEGATLDLAGDIEINSNCNWRAIGCGPGWIERRREVWILPGLR